MLHSLWRNYTHNTRLFSPLSVMVYMHKRLDGELSHLEKEHKVVA